MEKMIAVRLDEEHIQKLEKLVEITGWNQSEVLRRLIESAWVTPPAVGSDLSPKANALTVGAM
jgi:hypothetical protein